MTYRDKEKLKAYRKAYYQANKHRIDARNKAWQQKNQEQHIAYQKQYHATHKGQRNVRSKAHYQAHRAQYLAYHKAYKQLHEKGRGHGLTVPQKRVMAEAVGYCCEICGKKEERLGKLHVDHCHTTGRIRGLLCHHCNALLGYAGDNPQTLAKAIEYLLRKENV